MNIVTDGSQVAVARSVNNKCLVTSTEEVPNDLVAMIEPGGVGAQKPLHASDQVGAGGFQYKMEVILHEHIGMHLPVATVASGARAFAVVVGLPLLVWGVHRLRHRVKTKQKER